MNTDINRQPPDREQEPDAPAQADGNDVIVFYDSEGEVALVLPAEDVVAIIPDRLLRRQLSVVLARETDTPRPGSVSRFHDATLP